MFKHFNDSFSNKTAKNSIFMLFSVLIILLSFTNSVYAETAVGIITSVEGDVVFNKDNGRAVDFGDDALNSQQIKVGNKSSLILTYYVGCRQEWYGENTTIEIGKSKSKILKGKLDKVDNFDCEVPEVVLDEKDSFKKAAFHFRSIGGVKKEPKKQVLTAIHSSSLKTNSWGNKNKDLKLRMWTAKKEGVPYHTGEQIIIYLVSNKAAHIKLDYHTVDGNVVHLVPNLFKGKAKVKPGQIYVIGGNKSKIKLAVEKPYGKETLKALVSLKPFDKKFSSELLVEKSDEYTTNQKKLLLAHKNNRIDQYTLEIQTKH